MPPSQCFGPFRLDPTAHRLWRDSEQLHLRAKAFSVLTYLAERPGRLVTHDELRQVIWSGASISEGLLRAYIKELRRLLGDEIERPRYIETVPARGYRFVAPVTSTVDAIAETADAAPADSARHRPVRRSRPVSARDFVGREAELTELHRRLHLAHAGERQVVVVSGERGIGKTAVLRMFLDKASAEHATLIALGQCVEQYGEGEAYRPVFEVLQRLCADPAAAQVVATLERHAPMWLLQMPGMLADDRFTALRQRLEGATQTRMLRELILALEALGAEQSVIIVLEDLQWSDPSTLDLVSLLARRQEVARLMLICSYRPAEVGPVTVQLRQMLDELRLRGECAELSLGGLDEDALIRYLGSRFPGNDFPPELARAVYRSTEGNPLFMGAIAADLVHRRRIEADEGRWRLRSPIGESETLAPEGLRRLIDGMIERLSEEEQRVLEASSLVGPEFATGPVAAALISTPDEVEALCMGLVRGGQFLRHMGSKSAPGGAIQSHFAVVHSLYHEVARTRCPPQREQLWSRRIGDYIEAACGERIGDVATRLAVHFERAGDDDRAVRYHAFAAEGAMARFARTEAIGHLTDALELLQGLPEGPDRDVRELSMLASLGPLLSATRGYGSPEVEAVNLRSFDLAQRTEDVPRTFQVLLGAYVHSFMRPNFRRASEIGDRLEQIARSEGAPALIGVALAARAAPLSTTGEFTRARQLLHEAATLIDASAVRSLGVLITRDPRIITRTQLALIEWALGYPDRGLDAATSALEVAMQTSNPFGQAAALTTLAQIRVNRREAAAAEEAAQRALDLMKDHEFPYYRGEAKLLLGWAQVARGAADGLHHVRGGLVERLAAASAKTSLMQTMAAEAYLGAGELESGLRATEEAIRFAREHQELAFEGEALRVRAVLLLRDAELSLSRATEDRTEARRCAMLAVHLARRLSAKMHELRAAIVLAREGWTLEDGEPATDVLATAYGWFQEGHPLLDLAEARVLLHESSGRRAAGVLD